MTLTPEKVAFIHGEPTQKGKTPNVTTQAAATAKTVERSEPNEVLPAEGKSPRRRNRSRVVTQEEPRASEILDEILVPVTIRLKHRTAQALKRAALEQKLRHMKPDQVQEIGEEAIAEWLDKSGYLE